MNKNKPKPLDLEDLFEILQRKIIVYNFEENMREISEKYAELFDKEGLIYKNIREAIDEIKHRIKSACVFWLRYKDNPDLLIEEHPEYEYELKKKCMPKIDEMLSCIKIQVKTNEEVFVVCYDRYNEWLFKLAFRGVFDDEKKES